MIVAAVTLVLAGQAFTPPPPAPKSCNEAPARASASPDAGSGLRPLADEPPARAIAAVDGVYRGCAAMLVLDGPDAGWRSLPRPRLHALPRD